MNVGSGMSTVSAGRAFLRKFHGVQQVKTNKGYAWYLGVGFTVPFVLSYYSTYLVASDEGLKGKSNPRCYFTKFI